MTEIGINDFKGPLDLLLKLITDRKIDILDIPIAEITDQYNSIINSWEVFDLEEASDYIVMAARLIQIKSRMLLPRQEELESEEDPREELTRQLITYAVFQKVAHYLEDAEAKSSMNLEKDPEYIPELIKEIPGKINTKVLVRALRRVIANQEVQERSNLIYSERFTIEECKEFLKNSLMRNPILFAECFGQSPTKEEIITIFLAMLELYKTGFLNFEQIGNEIRITRREC